MSRTSMTRLSHYVELFLKSRIISLYNLIKILFMTGTLMSRISCCLKFLGLPLFYKSNKIITNKSNF